MNMNVENLKIWRDFLISNDVPFEMQFYRSKNGQGECITKDEVDAGVEGCGTAGCAIGWAPFAVPAEKDDFFMHHSENKLLLDFFKYVPRAFGLSTYSGEYDFIIEMDWKQIDNTRLGAAFRIDCVINGAVRLFVPVATKYWSPDNMSIAQEDMYKKMRNQWVASLGETA